MLQYSYLFIIMIIYLGMLADLCYRRKHQGLLHQHRKDVQRIEAALKDLRTGLPISTSQDSTPEVQRQGQTWNIRPVGTVVSSWYKVRK